MKSTARIQLNDDATGYRLDSLSLEDRGAPDDPWELSNRHVHVEDEDRQALFIVRSALEARALAGVLAEAADLLDDYDRQHGLVDTEVPA